MKDYQFAYGKGSVTVPLDERSVLAVLHGNEAPAMQDIRAGLVESLENPIGAKPLREEIPAGARVALVVSDMSRFWMRQDLVIPHLVAYLHTACGVSYERLTIVVANGTHLGGSEQELRTLVTPEVFDRVKVENHDCEAKNLVYLGTTAHDTPVWINHTVAAADFVVCLGACTHHIMAGFGGGRKSILPGVSGLQTIRHNHAYSLDPGALRSNPKIGNGVLEGNPLHEDMCEAAAMLPAPVHGESRHERADAAVRDFLGALSQILGRRLQARQQNLSGGCAGTGGRDRHQLRRLPEGHLPLIRGPRRSTTSSPA